MKSEDKKNTSKPAKYQYLTNRQQDVIDDLFGGKFSESEVMKRHKISKIVFTKWFSDNLFVRELQFRVESSRRQSEMIIARYAPAAAAKLVALTDSEKEETARKACLDIITTPCDKKDKAGEDHAETSQPSENISQQTASRLLEALSKD